MGHPSFTFVVFLSNTINSLSSQMNSNQLKKVVFIFLGMNLCAFLLLKLSISGHTNHQFFAVDFDTLKPL